MEQIINQLHSLNYKTLIIKHKNWTYNNLSEYFSSDDYKTLIVLFDTDTVGYGQFGIDNSTEKDREKWKNGIGYIKYREGSNVFIGVFPKIVLHIDSLKAYMNLYNICDNCDMEVKHVKINNINGTKYCIDCYNKTEILAQF